ncbi:hypothetical protein ABBQ32_006631 [Trebouxia sp. C0010 RCD-2024]
MATILKDTTACKLADKSQTVKKSAHRRGEKVFAQFWARSQKPYRPSDKPSRREFVLRSVNVAVLAEAALNQSDPRTIVNSLLGAYGLPQLKGTPGFRAFDDPERNFLLEYPKSWVGRANRQRQGMSVSDFNSSDKLIVEIFPEPEQQSERVRAILEHLISPGQEVGGDSRLLIPSNQNVVTAEEQIAGQTYMYMRFPSETITRSGYQIKRKNLAVAATVKGTVYCCVASARSDQYDKLKETLLTHIIESFRVRQM